MTNEHEIIRDISKRCQDCIVLRQRGHASNALCVAAEKLRVLLAKYTVDGLLFNSLDVAINLAKFDREYARCNDLRKQYLRDLDMIG